MRIRTKKKHLFTAAVVTVPGILLSNGLRAAPFTWNGSVDNTWANPGNWTPSGPPGSADTASFSNDLASNTNIDMGGATQSLNSLTFSAPSTSYNVGITPGDTILFSLSPSISNNSTVSQTVSANVTMSGTSTGNGGILTINATSGGNLTLLGTLQNGGQNNFNVSTAAGATVTFGAPNTTSTINLFKNGGGGGKNSSMNLAANSFLVINDAITDAGGTLGPQEMFYNSVGGNSSTNNAGTVLINGSNTYAGTTGLNAKSGQVLEIGVDSVGGPGAVTSGAFGTGAIIPGNSPTTPTSLDPHGANRTVNNAITFGSNFAVANDSSGTFNFTLGGPITMATGQTLFNNMNAGANLNLGIQGNASTISLGNSSSTPRVLTFQSSANLGGSTIVNDVIQNATGTTIGSVTIKGGGPVYLMASNTYTGGTTVNGTGAVGSGGTLAGTGTVGVGGVVTLSGTSAASQGGIVAPGSAPATAGTLHVPGMQWNALGRYTFDYNGNDSTAGSGVNDEIVGAGTLDLTNLGGTNQMNLNLNALVPNSGATETYTIASFAGGVLSGGTSLANTDITSDFTFSGTTGITPDVTVTPDGTGVQLTIVQGVPEPSALLLAAGAAGLLSLRNRRRKSARS